MPLMSMEKMKNCFPLKEEMATKFFEFFPIRIKSAGKFFFIAKQNPAIKYFQLE